ncbi:MAG: amino acid permease, partial [Sarcina sp.]
MGDKSKKITLFQLIAISIAFYGSIRNVPTVASVGWQSIFFMIGAGVLFAIPLSLIAAELATGWPEEGGSQVWVREALGDKWSFVTAWLLWVQMFFGMVMVASAFATMLAYVIGKPELAQNNVFVAIVIICTYWVVTLLNLKSNLGKLLSSVGSVIGIY